MAISCGAGGLRHNAILMNDGILTLEEDGAVLIRTGRSGPVRFERIVLPPCDDLNRFQGLWTHSAGGDRAHEAVEEDTWWSRLRIQGRVWKGARPDCGGLLELRQHDGAILLNGCAITVRSVGLEDFLRLSTGADSYELRCQDTCKGF